VNLQIRAWATTDVGRVRPQNEDNYLIDRELGLYAVADGMGGHQRGDVASALACDVLREHVRSNRGVIEAFDATPSAGNAGAVEEMLRAGFIKACEEIYEASSALAADSRPGRMGTTLDAVLVVRNVAFTAHVGDGRIYIARGGEAHPVTEDHSLVQEQIRAGVLTREQARKARHRNVITRALGAFPSVLVDTLQLELGEGDLLLLCSDGLHGRVSDRRLGVALSAVDETTTQLLVEMATDHGSRDNITALLVTVDGSDVLELDQERPAPSAEHMEALRRCELFSVCTYRELVRVAASCELRVYRAGEIIFQEGDRGSECFIVIDGLVDILREGVVLSRMGPSAFFGELAFLDEPARSATASARETTRVLSLSRVAFLGLLRQESALANKLLWRLLIRLSQVVRATNAQVLAQIGRLQTSDLELIDSDTWVD
jgi:serine/threonine protein phosphatase PrpC/CRP-like cAMP-binding protein